MSDFTVPRKVATLLQDVGCRWGVAGGWALDLFMNRVTRDHQDIEVAIFRDDQLVLQEHLSSRGGTFEYRHQGRSIPWPLAERLELPIHEIWVRMQSSYLSRLEILLNERHQDKFLFRRDPRVVALNSTFIRSNSGIPVLAPEIVLLYKAKYADEAKGNMDFFNVLDALDQSRRQWLFGSIRAVDPQHMWLPALKSTDPEPMKMQLRGRMGNDV